MDKIVDNCPQNLTETLEASTRLGCGRDKYGNDQYMCLPNLKTTSLVEFCHDGIMGFIERGNCLKTAESKIFTNKCSNFVSGCPDVDFRSNEIYNYPACQNISTGHRCYLADPYCANVTLNISTEETTGIFISKFITNRVIYNTTAMNIHTIKFQEDDSAHIWAIMGSLIAVLGLILLLVILKAMLKRLRRQRRKEKNGFMSEKENLLTETEKKVVEGATKREETSTISKQNESEKYITEFDICNENEEIKHCIAEVCVSGESKGNDIVYTETRVHNEPKKYGITEAGVNREPEGMEHIIFETGVHSDPEEKEHSISITVVNGELQERQHNEIEAGVNGELQEIELQEREHDVTEVGVNRESKEREHDVTEAGVNIESEKRDHDVTEAGVNIESEKREHDVTEAGVNRETEERDHDVTEAGVNIESEKREHDVTEAGVNIESEKRDHDVTEAGVNRESEKRDHDVTEAGVNRETEERDHDVTEAGVNIESKKREHDVTEAGVNIESKKREHNVTEAGVIRESEKRERLALLDHTMQRNQRMKIDPCVGEYNLWRSKISDEFSTLTDDEVSVLFCFLCSDSCPPDFTDREWLDLLNGIRLEVYNTRYPVTREEAQQTLDSLKSRDYLWEDQDKITKDTKDETMYRIASIKPHIPFCYSSYNTASVYLRSMGYKRKPGEKCVHGIWDSSLIHRLQMNILTHVTMEDTTIYDEIHKLLNLSDNILRGSEDQRKEFLVNLKREGEAVFYRGRSENSVDHLTWLWLYLRPGIVRSCIGLHPHWDIYIIDNKPYRKPSNRHTYSLKIWNLLYSILLAEKYQLNLDEQSHKIARDKIRDRYFTDVTDDGSVDLPDGITKSHNGVISFMSDDIRHDVIYAFATECLAEDSDLEFFLTTASRDVISEYCRSWDYKKSEGERCLYIPNKPEKMYDLFIDRLQLAILTHCTVSDGGIHDRISKRLGVPREVLRWDQEARERYVEYANRGTQTVHHARGMIVGCAWAGKTTLLKRLLGCTEKEIEEVKSTEGLEVHEEIFELCDEEKSLKARRKYKDQNNVESNSEKLDSKTLTFFDFGGQAAYYACHQIYLTGRAFYVVVVDSSKRLDQKVDEKVCDQDGSVFSGWTYGDYFVFWLKSIHTYCGSDNENDQKPVVLIVATHWEEGLRQFKDKNELMDSLRDQLPKPSNLSQYIRYDRFHCIQLSVPLHNLERSFYEIACDQQWKESIPKEWFFFQIEINQKKHYKRILKVSEITTDLPESTADSQKGLNEISKGKLDMLRYYHDAGKVLYFDENGLNEGLIIDIQWFIDAFKHIIKDRLHFTGIPGNEEDWDEYYKSGYLRNTLLIKIWKSKDDKLCEMLKKENEKYKIKMGSFRFDARYLKYHQESLLNFMQRLGLLVVGEESHYVPCMNRKEMEPAVPDLIRRSESKSSVLVYQFTFLPFFFFFRLVVACMQEENWKVLKTHGTPSLYKDAALFLVEGYTVVLSVTKESIQLQIVHPKKGCILELDNYKTQEIQERVENILYDFAGKFHRKLLFTRGFRCRVDDKNLIAMDINGHFLSEEDIQKDDGEMICPLHTVIDQHSINTKELKRYWKI